MSFACVALWLFKGEAPSPSGCINSKGAAYGDVSGNSTMGAGETRLDSKDVLDCALQGASGAKPARCSK